MPLYSHCYVGLLGGIAEKTLVLVILGAAVIQPLQRPVGDSTSARLLGGMAAVLPRAL